MTQTMQAWHGLALFFASLVQLDTHRYRHHMQNIIIGNALKDYVGFIDFMINLAPGVIMAIPGSIAVLVLMYKKDLMGARWGRVHNGMTSGKRPDHQIWMIWMISRGLRIHPYNCI